MRLSILATRLCVYVCIVVKGMYTCKIYKGTLIYVFHDEHDSYEYINLKKYNPDWYNSEPVERVYIKYDM